MSTLPFKALGDRIVIKADREENAPQSTDSGLLLAKTLTAAVDGSDADDSWFVGTVVGVGPLAQQFEVRPYVLRRLREMINHPDIHDDTPRKLAELMHEIELLPRDMPEPLTVGDRVTFSWASGQQLTVDGDRYLIMSQKDVLAILAADELETC